MLLRNYNGQPNNHTASLSVETTEDHRQDHMVVMLLFCSYAAAKTGRPHCCGRPACGPLASRSTLCLSPQSTLWCLMIQISRCVRIVNCVSALSASSGGIPVFSASCIIPEPVYYRSLSGTSWRATKVTLCNLFDFYLRPHVACVCERMGIIWVSSINKQMID